jgi:rod shape-determining protein MreC
MSYNQEVGGQKKIVAVVAVLFLNLILMSSNIILKNDKSLLQNGIGLLISPFQIGFQKSIDYVSHQFRRYVYLQNMFQEYHELKKEYTRLKYENYLLKTRMERFRFYESAREKHNSFVTAELISIDANFPYGSITINKGSSDGIEPGMVVLNGDGELVGKTIEPITMFTARVRLITSSTGGVGAYIRENVLEGFLSGNNTKVCEFKYLIENMPVDVGDELVTSGTDEIFPPYIPIGKVIATEKEPLLLKVFVKPFFVGKSIKQLVIVKR